MFKIFNYLSNKTNLKLLSFVVCLQSFVKLIKPPVTTLSIKGFFFFFFLPYRCIKAVVNISYRRKSFSHFRNIAKILQVQVFQSFISPFRSNFQKVTYITTHNNRNGIFHYPKNHILCEKSLNRNEFFYDNDFHLYRFRPFVLIFWDTKPLLQSNISNMHYR